MNTSISPSCRAAFTLLELLIVITIIAILTGLGVGAYNSVMLKARNLEALTVAKGIELAVNNYRSETGRMPVVGHTRDDATIELTSGNPLLQVLLGNNVNELNRARRAYIDNVPMAKAGVNGITGQDGQFSLVDPWGQPYRVTMDTNDDNKIANPDAHNQDRNISGEASHQMPRSVIVESAGRDKRFGTQDDVVSWR